MSLSRTAVLSIVFMIGAFVSAAEQKPSSYVLCKLQKTVRAIHITPETAPDKTCRVTYMKTGVDEIVGQARTMDGCKSILSSVKKNLEASNWKCRDVGSATITTSSEISVQ